MSCSRRSFLLISAGFLAGCAGASRDRIAMPGVPWSEANTPRPHDDDQPLYVSPDAPAANGALAGVISRTKWAKGKPRPARMNPLGAVKRITVHHDAEYSSATSQSACAARLDSIRRYHQDSRGWGDIGYHYVIDRAGRVWEGRPIAYQGAHVKNRNENNIGVVCLGNFDLQTPTTAQLASLNKHLRVLMQKHRVPVRYLYTHQELGKTACPGRALQAHMVSARKSSTLKT